MTDEVRAFWDAYIHSTPPPHPDTPDDVFSFGDSPEMADELGELVVRGFKTASASSRWAEDLGIEPRAQPGMVSVVLDGAGRPLCVIEMVEVFERSFLEVDEQFAYDEGEGDRSLAYWREAHREYFSRTLPAEVGREFDETMPVVCERFRVVYPVNP